MDNQQYGGNAASGVKEQAREKLSQAKERTTEQVESRVAQQKSRAAETLSGVAQSLKASSQHLRDQQHASTGQYMERAAEEVERLAHYLDTRNVSDIVHQVEDLARRQPAVFIGGAVAVGFLAARFLKASERQLGDDGSRNVPDVYRGGYADVPATGMSDAYPTDSRRFE